MIRDLYYRLTWPIRRLWHRRRYYVPALTHYYWVGTIADPAAPTQAEIDVGLDLTNQIAEMWGFGPIREVGPGPFADRLPGVITDTLPWIDFYTSPTSVSPRDVFPQGETGYLIYDDPDDNLMDVYPVTVSSARLADDVGRCRVSFLITGMPSTVGRSYARA